MRLAREISLSLVLDGGDVSATDDVGRLGQFDIRGSVPETINTETGEGDQVLLCLVNSEHCMTNLLYDDGARAERGFLRVMAYEFETLLLVLDHVCGDGRVMRYLFDEELSQSATITVRPASIEDFPKNWVKGSAKMFSIADGDDTRCFTFSLNPSSRFWKYIGL